MNGPIRSYVMLGKDLPTVHLTMFCTAHLQSDADVDRLLHPTASSVAHQTRPTKLWLSVSHEPAVNRQRVLALADRLPAGGRFIVPRSSKSQFEHLRLLCDKYVEQEPASLADTTSSQHWLLFMQGGDAVGRGRAEQFHNLIVTNRVADYDHMTRPGLHSRDVVHISSPVHMMDPHDMVMDAHYMYAVTVRCLHYFLTHTQSIVLHHPTAEHTFIGYLRIPDAKLCQTASTASDPFAYSRHPRRSGASSEADMSEVSLLTYAGQFRNPSASFVQQIQVEEWEKRHLLQLEAEAKHKHAELLRAVYAAPKLTDYMQTLPAPQPPPRC